jgi:hypothetical protein
MTRIKQESILASSPGIPTLNQFVRLLNTKYFWKASLIEGKQKIGGDYQPIQAEMRRLVQAWRRSGPNVIKLLDAQPEVNQAIQKSSPVFLPTNGSVGQLAYLTATEFSLTDKPLEIALGHFIQFLLNPYNEKLGGPCKQCGNYYVKKSERKKAVYCSVRCGHRFTSRLANKERRDREHEKQFKLAKKSIARWRNAKTSKPWKEWVSIETNISKQWLTRAVEKREISEPVKSRVRLGTTK